MIKFGIFDHMDDDGAGISAQFETRLRLAELYDRSGFFAYHLAEHHSTPLGHAPSPSVYLSALAQRTKRLRFGPLVYLLPFYYPIRLIEEICMLDHLSGGRLELGIGRGISPIEAGFYGYDPVALSDMYHEAYNVLIKGLRNEELDFSGTYYNFSKVPMTLQPVQKPNPPLWYGVTNPDSTIWAAENGVNIVTINTDDRVKAVTDRYRAEWARVGNSPETLPIMGVSRHLVVADTDEEAQRIAARAYPRWRSAFHYLWERYNPNAKRTAIAHLYPETWQETQAIGNGFAGSPQSVRDYVERTIAATGVNYLIFWFAFGDLSYEEAGRSAELFAQHVMPHF